MDERLAFDINCFILNKNCFPYKARKKLVESTFLSIIDYGDHLYKHAATSLLRKLDSVYHAALHFITGAESRMHHCILYESLDWFCLHQRRKLHSS